MTIIDAVQTGRALSRPCLLEGQPAWRQAARLAPLKAVNL